MLYSHSTDSVLVFREEEKAVCLQDQDLLDLQDLVHG